MANLFSWNAPLTLAGAPDQRDALLQALRSGQPVEIDVASPDDHIGRQLARAALRSAAAAGTALTARIAGQPLTADSITTDKEPAT